MVFGVIEVGRAHVSPGEQPTEARLRAPLGAGGPSVCGAESGAKSIDGDGPGGCAAGILWEIPHPARSGLDTVRGRTTHFERGGPLGTERVVKSKKSRKWQSAERLPSRPTWAPLAAPEAQ